MSKILTRHVWSEITGRAACCTLHPQTWRFASNTKINSAKNFPGPQNPDDRGLLIVDQTDKFKPRNLSRKMRRYNPIPSMFGNSTLPSPITTLVEDAVHRNSQHSYFIQLADVNAYFLFQSQQPCAYVKNKGARNYFRRLGPALCTVASRNHPGGIVFR
ncbi:MAG: DUF3800 domain-containing protein [Ectothiorhodospiraceae bacterium]|nr:DUF3800 domain-containing protein [Ectothiorhodospiraceae bacterium]